MLNLICTYDRGPRPSHPNLNASCSHGHGHLIQCSANVRTASLLASRILVMVCSFRCRGRGMSKASAFRSDLSLDRAFTLTEMCTPVESMLTDTSASLSTRSWAFQTSLLRGKFALSLHAGSLRRAHLHSAASDNPGRSNCRGRPAERSLTDVAASLRHEPEGTRRWDPAFPAIGSCPSCPSARTHIEMEGAEQVAMCPERSLGQRSIRKNESLVRHTVHT